MLSKALSLGSTIGIWRSLKTTLRHKPENHAQCSLQDDGEQCLQNLPQLQCPDQLCEQNALLCMHSQNSGRFSKFVIFFSFCYCCRLLTNSQLQKPASSSRPKSLTCPAQRFHLADLLILSLEMRVSKTSLCLPGASRHELNNNVN